MKKVHIYFSALLLCFIRTSEGQNEGATAIVRIVPGSTPSVEGEITVTPVDHGVAIKGKITGLTPGKHGFHIHSVPALGNSCKDAGGHFNPFQSDHGDPRDLRRHIGDLGNIEADESGTAIINIFDSQASMDPSSKAYIGNRSMVVHAAPDDLGRGGNLESLKTGNAGARVGCGLFEIQKQKKQQQQSTSSSSIKNLGRASVIMVPGSNPEIVGDLTLTPTSNGVIISGIVTGLSPGSHGFHVHEKGNLGNKCVDAGGHFNPFNTSHGGPQSSERHVGDLGNIEVDISGTAIINIRDTLISLDPSSEAYIGNLAIVIHAGSDDLGKGGDAGSLKTGNAGGRSGCGLILSEFDTVTVIQPEPTTEIIPPKLIAAEESARVKMIPGSTPGLDGDLTITSTEGGVIIKGQIRGLTPGLHRLQIHTTGDLGNSCKNAGGHFNPFEVTHVDPQDEIRHVGDLGNIEADESGTANIDISDPMVSLDQTSQAYIGNRAIVVHAGADDLGKGGNPESLKTGNAGARMGCGIIEDLQQQKQNNFQEIILPKSEDPSRFLNEDFAVVRIEPGSSPSTSGELRITPVEGGVSIRGEISGLTPGLHGFHIHAAGDLGNSCKNAGGTFNPFGANHGDPEAADRHVGDLGNIEADEIGRAIIDIFDAKASMDPASLAYIGNRAIVIHAEPDDMGRGRNPQSLKTGNTGARMGCGIIKVEKFRSLSTGVSVASGNVNSAFVRLVPGSNPDMAGTLDITAIEDGVLLTGRITGLTPGLHGFHIHTTGDLGNSCKNAGGHFNPFEATHGAPLSIVRHVGDLGNIEADETGSVDINITDAKASLDPSSRAYIGNRAVVVHAGTDDLGKGGNLESLKTGNAGARMGCGIIEVPQSQPQLQEQPLAQPQEQPIAQPQEQPLAQPQEQPLRRRRSLRMKRSYFSDDFYKSFADPYISSASVHFGGTGKIAHVKLIPGTDKKVHGDLKVIAVHEGVVIKGTIYGLKPGLHGFHVHEKGSLGNKCQDAGGHFNPFNMNHGDIHDYHRHIGDLGNVKANHKGVAHIDILDRKGSLDPHSDKFIGHRALVVHADPDDLGRGKNEDSKRTGNSGARLGCGVIDLKGSSSHGHHHGGLANLHGGHHGGHGGHNAGHGGHNGHHGGHHSGHGGHGNHHGGHHGGHGGHHAGHGHHSGHNCNSFKPLHGHSPKHTQTHHLHSPKHAHHGKHPKHAHHGKHPKHAHSGKQKAHHNVPIYRPTKKPQLNLGHGGHSGHSGSGFGHGGFY